MSQPIPVVEVLLSSILAAGVKYIFGIPGAKIDDIFDTLSQHPSLRLIVCRHEQNAAFMAAALGRLTSIPGICVDTSGPGASNLVTGLVTATTEGNPVVAIIGAVPRVQSTKHTHQSMDALGILRPTAKTAVSIEVADQAAELIVAAFRTAATSPKGAAVIQLPLDVAGSVTTIPEFPTYAFRPPTYGVALTEDIIRAGRMIEEAKLPVLFLGQRASSPKVVSAVRTLLRKWPMATIETFQAAGAIPHDLEHLFFGRVGLFQNQVGDRLLADADLIITLGYDPVEYDANLWNPERSANIVHVDVVKCDFGAFYAPKVELLGSVEENVLALSEMVTHVSDPRTHTLCKTLRAELLAWQDDVAESVEQPSSRGLVQPLHFIHELQKRVSKDTTVCCDVSTVYIYMMRYFRAYEPRRLLCSNGQQTLGVGMPWAIAACLAQQPPYSQKVISMSGDGGFMFSCQEPSTAVQQGCNITHFIWNDSHFNMVEFQEEIKYEGRSSGVKIGGVDFVKLAETFGGRGFRIEHPDEVETVMELALKHTGLALVDVRIDYSDSKSLAGRLIEDSVA